MEKYCKVLIVDDEFIMRQGIRHMVEWEKEGFQIVGEASDGKEALHMIRQCRPHIVLADIVMPVMDGLEFSIQMHEQYPDIQVVILSGHDNFEYVKTALLNGAADYILKPMTSPRNLLGILRKVSRNIPGIQYCREENVPYEMYISRYIGGFQRKLEENVFAEKMPYSKYRLMGVDMKELCRERKERPGELREKMEAYLQKNQDISFLSAMVEERYLLFLCNYRVKDKEELMKLAHGMQERMMHYQRFFLAVSWEYGSLQETRLVFQRGVKDLLGMRFYYPGTNMAVLAEAVERQKARRFGFEAYMEYINAEEFEEALDMFQEYVGYLVQIREEVYKVKDLVKNLLFNYLVETERLGISQEEERVRCFESIGNIEDAERFLEVLQAFVKDWRNRANGRKKPVDESVMEMKNYIREHFRENLELADLAEKWGFSYSYISTYFKENIQEGFCGYLNKMRVEEGKRMLLNTNMSVADIGNHLGYTDQSYFCRVFKKMTDLTPSEYRRKSRRGQK
ncbi:MAG: response regulator [Lachnospiraceae bacterium]|jgi:two-component system response regulator YesN|nr:response regulator [Lachnospiraceae bacterium]